MVALTGDVSNLAGQYFPDFTLVATPSRAFYDNGVLVTTASSLFPAMSGSITGSIHETETSGVLVAFSGNFTANGIYQEVLYIPTIIPNVAMINLNEFLQPLPPLN